MPQMDKEQQAPYTELGGSSPLSEEHMSEIWMRQGVFRGAAALRFVFFQLLYPPEFDDRMRERN